MSEIFLDHSDRVRDLLQVLAAGADTPEPGTGLTKKKSRVHFPDQNRREELHSLRLIGDIKEPQGIFSEIRRAGKHGVRGRITGAQRFSPRGQVTARAP